MKILLNKKLIYILSIFIQIISIFFTTNQTFANSTTISYAGTANDLGGLNIWTDPSNATGDTTSTSASSTLLLRNTNTNFISLTNFDIGTQIPNGAVINGISVDVERLVSSNRMVDYTVQLTKDGTNGIGNNNANNSNGPTTKSITSYGSATDLWGATWTKTDFSSPNFGVLLQYRNTQNGAKTVDVYRVGITIDYTIPAKPGGVTNGLQLWLKADKGTSTTNDGNPVNSWNDQSGNGYDAGTGNAPRYINNDTDNLNYNPLVDFNGTNDYLENLNNGVYSHSYYAVIVPDLQINGMATSQVPFGFDCVSGTLSSGTCGLNYAGLTLGAFSVALNDEVVTHALGSSVNWRSSQVGAASYDAGKPMLIGVNENSSQDGTDIYEKGIKIDNFETNTYQTLSSADYSIGRSMDSGYRFYYDGKIAEVINYSTGLNDTDRKKIESYLALKYGITLDSGTQNYIASNGTTIMWNTSTAGTYTNNIFGIGRDDKSELGQVKSKSVGSDNIVTIEAIGEGTNSSPSFSDINDFEFLTIANNYGGNTWTQTDAAAGFYNLTRKWKTQETGELGTINLDFDVGNLNFDVPVPSLGVNYYFVYDSNNNSSLSDEIPMIMTNTTGNIWQISGINLNNNQIFTISSQASLNNIPTDIALSNDTIDENVPAGTEIGTFSTNDADPLDTHTYSFVAGAGDEDNSSFNISGSTLYINESPDYELQSTYSIRVLTDDGNGGQFQKSFTIYINDLTETINTIIDFEEVSDENQYTVTSGTWTRTITNPYEGLYSIESDNGGVNNTQSCFEVVNTFSSTGTIDFFYDVSSQAGSDYLGFYIDNIEVETWSGSIAWSEYIKADIASGTHSFKWCYIKDGVGSTGTDNAFVDYIIFKDTFDGFLLGPTITGTNYSNGTLLPGGNHDLIVYYYDLVSGVDTSSDIVSLRKWNGGSWGSDMSSTGLDLGSKIVNSTSATYPTNNLSYGKYLLDFSIANNLGIYSSLGGGLEFYIDEPEIIVASGTIDIGNLDEGITKFSTGLNVTIKTVGAGFNVILNKDSSISYGTAEITDWNGSDGFGYDKEPYTSTINFINTNEIIATQTGSINTDGNKNTYIYGVKFGALIGTGQVAGDYAGNIRFGLDLDY